MLSIGELARLGEVSPRALRHYDDLGLLAPSEVDPQTGYRRYAMAQLRDLNRIVALRELGFSLAEVSLLLEGITSEQLREMLAWAAGAEDARYFALVPLAGTQPQGLAAYLRIAPEPGVVEIGHIWFGAELQRTTAATEAIYLLARHAFDDLGYRRLEWKCNALNAASRRAADRFGFSFEEIGRAHV